MADRDRRLRRVRRSWTDDEKRVMVAETRAPSVSVSSVARRHGLNANQLFNWIKDPRFGSEGVPMLPVDVVIDKSAVAQPTEQRIEIEFPDGVRLRCGSDLDAEALAQIVGVLRRAS